MKKSNEGAIITCRHFVTGGLENDGYYLDLEILTKNYESENEEDSRTEVSLLNFNFGNDILDNIEFNFVEEEINKPLAKNEDPAKSTGVVLISTAKDYDSEVAKEVEEIIAEGNMIQNNKYQVVYYSLKADKPKEDMCGSQDVIIVKFVAYEPRSGEKFVFNQAFTRKHFHETNFVYPYRLTVHRYK